MAWGQRDPALEQRWRERMAKWQSSGLTVRAFCSLHGLIEASFYYWKRELRARDVAAAKSPSGKESRVTFVPLTVMPITTTAVEKTKGSGLVVSVSRWISDTGASSGPQGGM